MSNIIAVNDVLISEVVCFDTTAQQVAVLNRYWKVASITGAGIIQFSDVATFLDTLLGPLYIALMYNQVLYRGTRVRRRFPVNLDQWQFDNSGAGPGTAGVVALPTQTAGLLKFTGNTLGKHGQGRQYVPFPSVSDNQTVGIPTAGYGTRLAALGTQLVLQQAVTVGGTTAQLIPGLWDTAAAAFTSVNQFVAADAWATQKRRGAFGRFNVPPF